MTTGPSDSWIRRHPRLTRLALNLIFLFILEGLLRTGLSEWLVPPKATSAVEYSRALHHSNRPGASYVRVPDPGDDYAPVTVQINALGIRGPMPAAKRGRRILILGDSTIAAEAVPFESTIQRLLTARSAPEIDFIGHGVMSWSPTIEFSWLAQVGLQLEPDEVLLFVDANDFMRASVFDMSDEAYRQAVRYGEEGVPVEYDVPLPSWRTALRSAARRFELVRIFDDAYRSWQGRRVVANSGGVSDEILALEAFRRTWSAEQNRAFDGTIDVIGAMNRYLVKRAIKLQIVVVPNPLIWPEEGTLLRETVGRSGASPDPGGGLEAAVASALEPFGIPVIRLRPAFVDRKRVPSAERFFLSRDGHLNANGYALAAEVLASLYSP